MVALRIALRYLLSKKSHNAVNIISSVSIAGVAVATVAIVCVLSVFNGFTKLAYDRISLIDPELKIVPVEGKVIENADSLAGVVAGVDGVECVSPSIEEQGLAVYSGRQMPVNIRGVARDFSSVVDIDSVIIDGGFMLEDSLHSYASLSVGTALSLGARPGYYDYLTLYVPRRTGRINAANPLAAFRVDSFVVSSVYQVEESGVDADGIIIPIEAARHLFDYTSQASALEIALEPGVELKSAAAAIAASAGRNCRVLTRLEQESASFHMIEVEKWITFAMLAFILIIASFNVVSTLSMLIIEKSPDMATLRALGASGGLSRRIFVLEGWLISVVGGVAGIVVGVVLCLAQQWGGFIKLNGDPGQLAITSYPVRVQLPDILAVAGLIIVTGFLVAVITSSIMSRK